MTGRKGAVSGLVFLTAVALAALFPLVFSTFVVDTAIIVLIYWIVGMGTVLLGGLGRQLSLGFAATFGVSAYGYAILTVNHHWSLLPACLLTLVLAEAVGLALALSSLHLQSIYLLMASLAQLMFINEIEGQWTAVTGGSDGIFGVGRPAGFSRDGVFFWLVAGIALLAAALLAVYVRSRRGRRLTAVGDSEVKMRALGHRAYAIRLEAYLIGGLVAAVAGMLFVWFEGVISPGDFGFDLAVNVVIMVIIGGLDSLFGALIGATLVGVGQNVLTGYIADWQIVVGSVFIVVVIVAPEGVARVARRMARSARRDRRGLLVASTVGPVRPPTYVEPSPVEVNAPDGAGGAGG